MHHYEAEVTRDGRWWMVSVPELGLLTQARAAGEVELMAREVIAVSLGVPVDSAGVEVVHGAE